MTRTRSISSNRSTVSRQTGPLTRSNGSRIRIAVSRSISALRAGSESACTSITGRRTGMKGETCWTGRPSTSGKVVRMASCRRNSSVSTYSRLSIRIGPCKRTAKPRWLTGTPGANWLRNHNRSWAKESGTGSALPRGGMVGGMAWAPAWIQASSRARRVGDNGVASRSALRLTVSPLRRRLGRLLQGGDGLLFAEDLRLFQQRLFHQLRQPPHGRALEQGRERQLDLEPGANARGHLHRNEGVAAQLEEVVVD